MPGEYEGGNSRPDYSGDSELRTRVVRYSTVVGDYDVDDDFLRIIGTFGPGPLRVRDIKIGDVPIEDIPDSDFTIYDGGSNIAPTNSNGRLRWYGKTKRTEAVNTVIDASDDPENDWVQFATLDDPVEARFDLSFPAGLYHVGRKNRKFTRIVNFDYRWRPRPAPGVRRESLAGGNRQPWQEGDADENRWRTSRYTRNHAVVTTPFFFQILIDFPTDVDLQYGADVAIRRLERSGQNQNTDVSRLVRFESKRPDDVNKLPSNYTIFEARIKADARINGRVPNVTAQVSRMIPDYSDTSITTSAPQNAKTASVLKETNNPAWVYLAALKGVNWRSHYRNPDWQPQEFVLDDDGEPTTERRDDYDPVEFNRVPDADYNTSLVKDEEIDWDAFKAWAEWCDETVNAQLRDSQGTLYKGWKNATFDAVIDKRDTIDKVLQNIASAGYAVPIMKGSLYSIYWETQPRQPIALLTPATTNSFESTVEWPEEVHGYNVSYFDPDNNYKAATVIAYADGYNADNATIVKDLDARRIGAANRVSAWRYGRYRLKDEEVHTEQFKLRVGVESMLFNVGDVVHLSSDVIAGKRRPDDGIVVGDNTDYGGLFGRIEQTRWFGEGTYTIHGATVQLPPTGDIVSAFVLTLDQDIPSGFLREYSEVEGEPIGGRRMIIETGESDHKLIEAQAFRIAGDLNVRQSNLFPFPGRLLPPAPTRQIDLDADPYENRDRGVLVIVNTIGLADYFITPDQMRFSNGFTGFEYSIDNDDGETIPCVIHGIQNERDNSARLTLRRFRPNDLEASWAGNVPSSLVSIEPRGGVVPPRPVIADILHAGNVYARSVDDSRLVSDLIVFLDRVDIADTATIARASVTWRLSAESRVPRFMRTGDDYGGRWAGSPFQGDSYVRAIISGVPVGAHFDVRVVYENAGGEEGESIVVTRFNDAEQGNVEIPPPTHLEIEGGGTEFTGRGLRLVWTDGSVIDASEGLDTIPFGAGSQDPNFGGYRVVVRGDTSPLVEGTRYRVLLDEIVRQPQFDYLPDITPADDGPYRYLRFEVSRLDRLYGESDPAVLDVMNPPFTRKNYGLLESNIPNKASRAVTVFPGYQTSREIYFSPSLEDINHDDYREIRVFRLDIPDTTFPGNPYFANYMGLSGGYNDKSSQPGVNWQTDSNGGFAPNSEEVVGSVQHTISVTASVSFFTATERDRASVILEDAPAQPETLVFTSSWEIFRRQQRLPYFFLVTIADLFDRPYLGDGSMSVTFNLPFRRPKSTGSGFRYPDGSIPAASDIQLCSDEGYFYPNSDGQYRRLRLYNTSFYDNLPGVIGPDGIPAYLYIRWA